MFSWNLLQKRNEHHLTLFSVFSLVCSESCWILRSGTACWRSCSRTCRTNGNPWRPSSTHFEVHGPCTLAAQTGYSALSAPLFPLLHIFMLPARFIYICSPVNEGFAHLLCSGGVEGMQFFWLFFFMITTELSKMNQEVQKKRVNPNACRAPCLVLDYKVSVLRLFWTVLLPFIHLECF